jgi:hypothetical protein
MSELHSFFAVTLTSLYWVTDRKDQHDWPIVMKIGIAGQSNIPVNAMLKNGTMVGITGPVGIMLYHPSSRSRLPEMVNVESWGDHTSPLVGLFLSEIGARECLATENRVVCDPRFIEETRKVIDAIGSNHPVFVIALEESLRLPIPEVASVADTEDIINEG